MIQTQFNSNIKTLRTDHGSKYISHEFSTFLLQHGITHQFSCPYTSKQNGITERKNPQILETARTIHHASLVLQFWLEAASTAAYLINRLPTKTLHMHYPYQKLYNKSPSFLHLKTFRCLGYPWTAYTCHHKLDPKSSTCIFLCYSTDHKGFRCFDPATSKLIIYRHIRFHEHEFPMAISTNPPHSPQISTIHNPYHHYLFQRSIHHPPRPPPKPPPPPKKPPQKKPPPNPPPPTPLPHPPNPNTKPTGSPSPQNRHPHPISTTSSPPHHLTSLQPPTHPPITRPNLHPLYPQSTSIYPPYENPPSTNHPHPLPQPFPHHNRSPHLPPSLL